MATIGQRWYSQLRLASFLILSGAIAFLGDCTVAQVAPDDTLGAESSVVTPSVIDDIPRDRIDGGAIRGTNLFHSFREFNINEGRGAYFTNPTGIENILSRVTGANPSNILGRLGVLGDANLFLINPNGIIFGPNARLDVGGSFVATTANAIGFGELGFFSASAPNESELLTVNPSAFLFNQIAAQSITNQSVEGLQVPADQSLLLVGGDVRLDGGKLTAPGGRVELGGLASFGTVGLNVDDNNWRLNFPVEAARADVSLIDGALVDVTAGGGGSIALNAQNLALSGGSGLLAGIGAGLGSDGTRAGNIEIDALDKITISEASDTGASNRIANLVNAGAIGNAGNIDINTGSLNVIGNARIGSVTNGRGDAGSVTIQARDTVSFSGVNSAVLSSVGETGVGNGGDVNLQTRSLSLSDGAVLGTVTLGQGNAGNITITAAGAVSFDGVGTNGLPSGAFSSVLFAPGATGDRQSGDITIQAGSLSLTNGALLGPGPLEVSIFRQGKVGNIQINATDSVSVSGGSTLNTSTTGQGDGGNITINAGNTVSFDSSSAASLVRVRAIGKGKGGNINIQARSLSLTNNATLNSSTFGQGDAGNIQINVTDSVSVSGGSTLNTSTTGQGDAGDVSISAGDAVSFDGQGAGFPSGINTFVALPQIGSGRQGGNINIQARSLSLINNAVLESGTGGQGDAGSISVQASDSVTLINSFINSAVASIGVGNGGNINIQTRSLSLIDGAKLQSQTFGTGNAGNISVNAIDSITLSGVGLSGFSLSGNTLERGYSSGLISGTEAKASGRGGEIRVFTDALRISDGAVLSARTRNTADGGDIFVNTNTLEVINGGQILTTAFSSGRAGDIFIDAANSITLSGSDPTFFNRLAQFGPEIVDPGSPASGLFANTAPDSTGDGGSIFIDPDVVTIEDGARIAVNSAGSGQGGNITLEADWLNLNEGSITAETASNQGGNINLQIEDILNLRNNSQITATAGAGGDGGNISIDTDFLVATPLENSDIIANAFEGNGGNINIDATSIFGIEPRRAIEGNETNDIDASSEFGLSGTVEINTPEVDPNRDLVQLPTQPIETEIVQACAPSDTEEQSEFIITGRGGLPPSPEEPLDSDAIAVDWVTRPPQNPNSPPEVTTNSIAPEAAPIIEAQGWIVDENNEIVLIAHTPNNTWQNSPQCQEKAEGRGLQASEVSSEDSPSRGQEAEGGRQKARGKRQKAKGRSQRSERQNYSLLPNKFDPNILIASTEPKSLTAKIPERITINRFEVKGNTVFDSEELTELLAPYTDKPLSFVELLQARSAITEYYTKRGYITSGAYIPPQRLQNKVVTIQVVEGYLEDIEITGNKRLNSNYVSSRIETATNDSLQREELLAALQLLQQDPLIASLSAELKAGTRPGASVLAVDVREADSLRTPVRLDNRQAPSVGSFRRQLPFNQGNLFGFGDELFLAYSNTEGSDAFDSSYEIPFNARNGTIAIRGGLSSSEVIEEPFNQLNILGDSHYYELSLRQPIVQTPNQEFALGITASRWNSNIASLLDEFNVPPAELSPGADEEGRTAISALRFFQEWTRRNSIEVFALRSEFNLGLDLFGATVNEDAPDSRFFAWQGLAQWARQLAPDTLLLLRGGIQLATTALLPSEQFGLGGLETVRGYRQDLWLADNAAFASAEIRLPILRLPQIDSVFQIAPFFDVGTAWNNGDARDVADPNTLASVGLGLRLSFFNSFTVRFDWGLPLISVDSESRTWQENGLYFSVEYSPF